MIIYFLLNLVVAQECPNIYFLGPLQYQTQTIGYAKGYNLIIIPQSTDLYLMLCESGTLYQIIETNMQSVLSLKTYGNLLVAGGENLVNAWQMDQNGQLENQLNIQGNALSIEISNTTIIIGTDTAQIIMWDPYLSKIQGITKSSYIQSILYTYTSGYNIIVLGYSEAYYFQFYTDNLKNLQCSIQILQFTLQTIQYDISQSYYNIFLAYQQNITFYKFYPSNNTLSIQNIQVYNFSIVQLQIKEDYLIIFGDSCQMLLLNITNLVFIKNITFATCSPIQQLIYNDDIDQIIILNQQQNYMEDMIVLYEGNGNQTPLRSFLYMPYQYANILNAFNYTFVTLLQSNLIAIYNPWFQVQQILNIGFNNQVTQNMAQIGQYIVLQTSLGDIVLLSQDQIQCKYQNYICYNFTISQAFVSSISGTITNLCLQSFMNGSKLYVIQSINSYIILLEIQSNQLIQLYQQALKYNILQIGIQNNTVLILLLNQTLVAYEFTNNQIQFQYLILTQNSSQFTFDSENIYINNKNQINMYQDGLLFQTYSYSNIDFLQIQIYLDQILYVQDDSEYINFVQLGNDISKPYQLIQTFQFLNSFQLINNYLNIIQQKYIQIIILNEYFNGSRTSGCVFKQNFSGIESYSYISIQNSFKQILQLYNTVYYLDIIVAQIYLQYIIQWNQIIVDQLINRNVILYLYGDNINGAILYITIWINQFLEVFLKDLNIFILQSKKLSMSNIFNVTIDNTYFVCPDICLAYSFYNIAQLNIQNARVYGQTTNETIINLSKVQVFKLRNLIMFNSTFASLVSTETAYLLDMANISIYNNTFINSNFLFQYYSMKVEQFSFFNNTVGQTIFQNYIVESNQIAINMRNIQINYNRFYNWQSGFFLSCVCSNTLNNISIVYFENLNLTMNTFNQETTTICALNLIYGNQISLINSYFDNSGVVIKSFTQISIFNVQFDGLQTVGLDIQDVTTLYIDQFQGNNVNLGIYSIIQVQNLRSINNTTIFLNQITFQNVSLISNNLIFNTFGIFLSFNNQTSITLKNVFFTKMNLVAAEQSFQITSTAIYVFGYKISLLIQDSQFFNNQYTLSTSLFVIYVQYLQIENVNIKNFNTTSKSFFDTMSENGGIAQVYCQYLTVLNSQFSQITSLNGAVFYIQTFSVEQVNQQSNLRFINISISGVLSYGSGAIYVDNMNSYTNIDFIECQFQNIYSLQSGGILYLHNDKIKNNFNFNLSQLNSTSISQFKLKRYINFTQCSYRNIFSPNGTIVIASNTYLIFVNNYFQGNIAQQFNSPLNQDQSISQGSIIYVEYSILIFSNNTFSNIILQPNMTEIGSVIITYQCLIQMDQLLIRQSQFLEQPMLQIIKSLMIMNQSYFQLNEAYSAINQISLILFQDSKAYIKNSQILNNLCNSSDQLPTCLSGGIGSINGSIYLENSILNNNKGDIGGALYFNSFHDNLTIINSTFNNNKANYYGGSIYAVIDILSLINIQYSNFTNNIAKNGGAIYTKYLDYNINTQLIQVDQPIIFYNNCYFINNQAKFYGGAMKIEIFNPQLIQTQFMNNYAGTEGNDISSYPQYLFLQQPQNEGINQFVYDTQLNLDQGYSFVQQNNLGLYKISNFKSGDTINNSFIFLMKSSSNQTMTEEYFPLTITTDNTSFKVDKTYFNFLNGQYDLTDILIYGIPNVTSTLYLTSQSIKSTSQFKYYFTNTYNYTLNVQFRQCLYGEILQFVTPIYTCVQCAETFYSITLPTAQNPGQCQICQQDNHLLCFGGSRMNVSSGYWRQDVISTIIYPCDQQLSNCIGGNTSQLCGIGYVGPLCQECDYSNDYARDTYGNCTLCSDTQWPITQIIITLLGIFLYLTISIYFVVKDVIFLCLLPCLNQMLPPSKRISMNFSQIQNLNSLMKIFLSYFQIVTIVKYVTTNLPIWVSQASDPNLLSFSIECPLLQISQYIGVPVSYIIYVLYALQPIFYMFLLIIVYAISFRNNKVYQKVYRWSAYLVIWIYYLPQFYKRTLNILDCQTIGNYSYVQGDLTQVCYGQIHFLFVFIVVIPLMVSSVFYIPIIIIFKFGVDKSRLEQSRPLKKLQFYYINGEFKEEYYYWEFFRITEKLAIWTFIEVFKYNVIYMAESCLIVVLIYTILLKRYSPYECVEQNEVDLYSSVAGIIMLYIYQAFSTIFLAMIVSSVQYQTQQQTSIMVYFYQFLIGTINVIYIIWISSKILRASLPIAIMNYRDIQLNLSDIPITRKLFLSPKKRTRITFQRVVNTIIVQNIIRRKQIKLMERLKISQQLKEKYGIQLGKRKKRDRKDIISYISEMDNPMEATILDGWEIRNDEDNFGQNFIELEPIQ